MFSTRTLHEIRHEKGWWMTGVISKQLFRDLFQKKTSPRVVFIPMLCSFAAKLKQMSVKEMMSRPGHLSNCQRDALRLIGHDAMLNVFDTTLEAEALGCHVEWENEDNLSRIVSHPLGAQGDVGMLPPHFEQRGRMPIVLEATRRLTTLMGNQAAVIGVITGPLTMGAHLRGDAFLEEVKTGMPGADRILQFAGLTCLKESSLYCELNVDAILILEEAAGQINEEIMKAAEPVLQSIINLAHYYEKPLLVFARGCMEMAVVDRFYRSGIDGLILGSPLSIVDLRGLSQNSDVCVAEAIPTNLLLSTPESIRDTIIDCIQRVSAVKGSFLTTDWDIPYHVPIQSLQEIVNCIRI